jgi:AcrR family transcriptional regulator
MTIHNIEQVFKPRHHMSEALKTKTQQLRRDHILDSAIQVFDAEGFRGATIHTIAQAAGISDGTVYNVFENKEDILLAVLQRLLHSSLQGAAIPPPAITLGQLLRLMVASRWNSMTPETLAMMRVVWSEALINRNLASQYCETILAPILAAPEPLFETLIARGEMVDTDVPMALRTMAATFIGFTMLRLLGDPLVNQRSEDVPAQLAEILLEGLKPRGCNDAV